MNGKELKELEERANRSSSEACPSECCWLPEVRKLIKEIKRRRQKLKEIAYRAGMSSKPRAAHFVLFGVPLDDLFEEFDEGE